MTVDVHAHLYPERYMAVLARSGGRYGVGVERGATGAGGVPMKYIVPFESVPTYSPAGHSHTLNRRLVGKHNVGAGRVEVVHGELQPGGVAERHAHADVDQVVHVVAGRALAEIGDERAEVGPRTTLWIPATVPHEITAIGHEPLHLLVVYTPPLYR